MFSTRSLGFGYTFKDSLPSLMFSSSTIHKCGVFVCDRVKRGSSICPLIGTIVPCTQDHMANMAEYRYSLSTTHEIDPLNEARMFNHSCDPSVYIDSQWNFVALRDLCIGEEITVDYGTVDYADYSFVCMCKSVFCRGVCSGLVAETKAFQKEKKIYFSPFLRDRFLV